MATHKHRHISLACHSLTIYTAVTHVSTTRTMSYSDDDEEEEEQPFREARSLTEAIWWGVQDQSAAAAKDSLAILRQGVDYIASEIAFAFSPVIHTSDSYDYDMSNSSGWHSRHRARSGDVRRSRNRSSGPFHRSTTRSKSEMLKPAGILKKSKMGTTLQMEERDEESERAHRVRSTLSEGESSGKGPRNSSKNQKKKKKNGKKKKGESEPADILQVNDSTIGSFADELESLLNEAPEYRDDIFRPRTGDEPADGSERFGYLRTAHNDVPAGPQKREGFFSLSTSSEATENLTSFSAFTDADVVVDICSGNPKSLGSKISTEPQVQKKESSSSPHMEGKFHVEPLTPRSEDVKSEKDIRVEIAEIQQLIENLASKSSERKQHAATGLAIEHMNPEIASSQTQAQKKRSQEIKSLLQRLDRLSKRHNELKAARANTALSSNDSTLPELEAVSTRESHSALAKRVQDLRNKNAGFGANPGQTPSSPIRTNPPDLEPMSTRESRTLGSLQQTHQNMVESSGGVIGQSNVQHPRDTNQLAQKDAIVDLTNRDCNEQPSDGAFRSNQRGTNQAYANTQTSHKLSSTGPGSRIEEPIQLDSEHHANPQVEGEVIDLSLYEETGQVLSRPLYAQ